MADDAAPRPGRGGAGGGRGSGARATGATGGSHDLDMDPDNIFYGETWSRTFKTRKLWRRFCGELRKRQWLSLHYVHNTHFSRPQQWLVWVCATLGLLAVNALLAEPVPSVPLRHARHRRMFRPGANASLRRSPRTPPR